MVAQAFEKLMSNIELTLSIKNRDRYTQNLAVFRRDVTSVRVCQHFVL